MAPESHQGLPESVLKMKTEYEAGKYSSSPEELTPFKLPVKKVEKPTSPQKPINPNNPHEWMGPAAMYATRMPNPEALMLIYGAAKSVLKKSAARIHEHLSKIAPKQ